MKDNNERGNVIESTIKEVGIKENSMKLKRIITEGSYTDFLTSYGSELKDALNKIKKMAKWSKDKEFTDEEYDYKINESKIKMDQMKEPEDYKELSYSIVEKEVHGMEYVVAYPDPKGKESKEGLWGWESKDRSNRELYFEKDKKSAQSSLDGLGLFGESKNMKLSTIFEGLNKPVNEVTVHEAKSTEGERLWAAANKSTRYGFEDLLKYLNHKDVQQFAETDKHIQKDIKELKTRIYEMMNLLRDIGEATNTI